MMTCANSASPAVLWTEPMETIWQMLPGGVAPVARFKRPDITISDRLFVGAVVNLAPSHRWGAITWLSEVYRTSRETIYAIGKRACEGLLFPPRHPSSRAEETVATNSTSSPAPQVAVTDNRIKRSILTLSLPGGVALRPIEDCLNATLNVTRSPGFSSRIIDEAGRRAGEILDEIDYSPLGNVTLARDETYFDDLVFLVAVEPRTYVLLAGHVEKSCDGETWGVSLALDQNREGLQIDGLSEDGATFYPRSRREAASLLGAEFSPSVQKDVWHTEAKATRMVADLERIATRKLERAHGVGEDLIGLPWSEPAFDAWADVDEEAEWLVQVSGEARFWRGCVCDALEIVDLRSGEIRDREINQWLLGETIAGLRRLSHPRVDKLVSHLEDQQDELLTFLDLLEPKIVSWRQKLVRALSNVSDQVFFERAVARSWRLSQALINGHRQFRAQAEFASDLVAELTVGDENLRELSKELLNILESVVRTSCAAETVNSVLKPRLRVKRSFQSRETAQNWFNLFRLWFCMHPFKRSPKRKGKSPFQLAGIKVRTPDGRETDDWLEALGYPADA